MIYQQKVTMNTEQAEKALQFMTYPEWCTYMYYRQPTRLELYGMPKFKVSVSRETQAINYYRECLPFYEKIGFPNGCSKPSIFPTKENWIDVFFAIDKFVFHVKQFFIKEEKGLYSGWIITKGKSKGTVTF